MIGTARANPSTGSPKGGNTYFVTGLTGKQINKIQHGIHSPKLIESQIATLKNISGLGDPDLVKMATAKVHLRTGNSTEFYWGGDPVACSTQSGTEYSHRPPLLARLEQ